MIRKRTLHLYPALFSQGSLEGSITRDLSGRQRNLFFNNSARWSSTSRGSAKIASSSFRNTAALASLSIIGPVFGQLAERRESRMRRATFDAGSRAHAAIAPPKYTGSSSGRGTSRERAQSICEFLASGNENTSAKLLGSWLFHLGRRSRRNSHPSAYQEAGKRRPEVGKAKPMAQTGHRQMAT